MYKTLNKGYLSGSDIASFDIYPVNNSDSLINGNLWYVAKGIDSLRKWSEFKKPVWTWIETTLIDKNSPRKPTPKEIKAEVWMAIIHGARGIGYFCHSWNPSFVEAGLLQDRLTANAVSEINREITALAPVINSRDISGFADVASSNPSVPIDILTKRTVDATHIFSVAMRSGNTTARFKVNSGEMAEVLGENRTIPIINNTFSDSFDSYGVHLYKITSSEAKRARKGN